MTLQILGIGCGRDGTTSLTQILDNLFGLNNPGAYRVLHECDNAEIYQSAVAYVRDRNSQKCCSIISKWGQEAEIGNGYSFILPLFFEVFGKNLKLIHLKREKNENLASLINHTSWNPSHWGGYVDNAEHFEITRPTAHDYCEMTKSQWQSLPLDKKLGWYYDKTHSEIEKHKQNFTNVFSISTSQLNEDSKIVELRNFINPNWKNTTNPSHLNSNLNYDFSAMTREQKLVARTMWRGFDFQSALTDEHYALRHFFNLYLMSNGQKNLALSEKKIKEILTIEIKSIKSKAKPGFLKSYSIAVGRKMGFGLLKRFILNNCRFF